MVRFIFGQGIMLSPVTSIDYKGLSGLLIRDRVDYFKLMHVFKIRRGLAPTCMSRIFVPISDTHTYNIRQSGFNYTISKQLATVFFSCNKFYR